MRKVISKFQANSPPGGLMGRGEECNCGREHFVSFKMILQVSSERSCFSQDFWYVEASTLETLEDVAKVTAMERFSVKSCFS